MNSITNVQLGPHDKVCWCGGDCALGEYWHTVPGFLKVPAAALVWTAESPFNYGSLYMTVSAG